MQNHSALVQSLVKAQMEQAPSAAPNALDTLVQNVVYQVLQKVMEDVALRLGYEHTNVLEQSVCDLLGAQMLSAAQLKEYADRIVHDLWGSAKWWEQENELFAGASPEAAWVKNPFAVWSHLWKEHQTQKIVVG